MKTAATPSVMRVRARKVERARVSEASAQIEDNRGRPGVNRTPEIDLIGAGARAWRWDHRQRATRDEESGFVELHFDLADYDRVLGLLSRERPVWVAEQYPGQEG